MQYMHDHLPDGFHLQHVGDGPGRALEGADEAIMLGGHVRVGMEDNPFLAPGQYADSNAQLVEKIVRISRELGRDIATPDEAR